MRKVILILLVSVLWFNVGGGPALADGMFVPDALSPDYLVVRYHHVTVRIEDGHAVTRVEQEFYNPYSHLSWGFLLVLICWEESVRQRYIGQECCKTTNVKVSWGTLFSPFF